MARQQIVSYTVACDVCGEAVPESESDSASRTIGWQGAEYVLDLCSIHRAELDQVTAQVVVFVEAGQRTTPSRSRRAAGKTAGRSRPASSSAPSSGPAVGRTDLAAIRTWAQENGHKVGDRGRLPRSVIAAYDQAAEAPAAATGTAPAKRRSRRAAPVS